MVFSVIVLDVSKVMVTYWGVCLGLHFRTAVITQSDLPISRLSSPGSRHIDHQAGPCTTRFDSRHFSGKNIARISNLEFEALATR
jgi:hypothetical protein